MKKTYSLVLLAWILVLALAACGGGGAAAPEPAAEAADVVEETMEEVEAAAEAPAEEVVATAAEAPAEEAAETSAPEAPASEEAVVEEAAPSEATSADTIAGLPASGIDAETGLEINPAQVQPGVDYIIRGELINFSLIPTDSPEFLVESPAGVRYRIQSQALEDIAFTDGTVLEPHQFKRGIPAQATVRLMESATATSIMLSSDLVLLLTD
jgi:predicted small lipoprotein YifL